MAKKPVTKNKSDTRPPRNKRVTPSATQSKPAQDAKRKGQALAPASAAPSARSNRSRGKGGVQSGVKTPVISLELGEKLRQPVPERPRPGRPTKYRDEMPDEILDLASQGLTLAQICAQIGITYTTLHTWRNDPDKEEFNNAIHDAKFLSQAYWEALGHQGAKGTRDVDASIYKFLVSARFREDYNVPTRNELTGKDGGPIETSNIDHRSKIADRLARLSAGK